MLLPFTQVDVFAARPLYGNPVAVIHDADALDSEQMAAIARWTNLSETTFLLAPTTADADYRLRIFTPGGELPFAGHPTLGSCHAWLASGGQPRDCATVIQECGAGLVTIRRGDSALAFAAPPRLRCGPLEPGLLEKIKGALRLTAGAVIAHEWVDNGPGWCALLLDSGATVRSLRPDLAALGDIALGVIGRQSAGGDSDFEVRAFVPALGVPEDPVTGSLNAALAQWLIGTGLAPASYVVAQGTVLGRRGRVHLESEGEQIWVGGACHGVLRGDIALD
jgi:PhzF family phenazine biosynthesis protein